jgi:hypothetical protein
MTNEDTNLDEEIDSLALKIERQIAEHKNKDLPEFDSKYRRMEEAQTQNVMEMFS